MIIVMDEMIEEARRMAKAKRIQASERIRWTRLAGQLIWYKDSILNNKTYEVLEVEVSMLKEEGYRKPPALTPTLATQVPRNNRRPRTANKTTG